MSPKRSTHTITFDNNNFHRVSRSYVDLQKNIMQANQLQIISEYNENTHDINLPTKAEELLQKHARPVKNGELALPFHYLTDVLYPEIVSASHAALMINACHFFGNRITAQLSGCQNSEVYLRY